MIKEVSCYIRLAREEKNHPRNGDALGRSDLRTFESLKRRSDLENDEMMFRGDVPLEHLIVCHREFLMRWDTCRDSGADQNLTIAGAPSASFFTEFQGGVEQNDSYSGFGSRGVTCILKGIGQDAFSHPELFRKLERVWKLASY